MFKKRQKQVLVPLYTVQGWLLGLWVFCWKVCNCHVMLITNIPFVGEGRWLWALNPGEETKRRETIGTFRLKQVKQILVAYLSHRIQKHLRSWSAKFILELRKFPGTRPAFAGWLSRMAYYSYMIPIKPPHHIWPLLSVLGWTVALESLAYLIHI